jgi:hypothetical protein
VVEGFSFLMMFWQVRTTSSAEPVKSGWLGVQQDVTHGKNAAESVFCVHDYQPPYPGLFHRLQRNVNVVVLLATEHMPLAHFAHLERTSCYVPRAQRHANIAVGHYAANLSVGIHDRQKTTIDFPHHFRCGRHVGRCLA